MLREYRLAEAGGSERVVFQEREFTLGGQLNEDGTTRLEVALLAPGGKTTVELRLLTRSEGIGWYVQRRIQLDPPQIKALKAILGRGAGRVKSSIPKANTTCIIGPGARTNPQGLSLSLCP